MADKTFGFKVTEEMYDKLKQTIESSGDSAKDWLEKAYSLVAIQSIKEGSADYKPDLSELEMHTTRIYELVANMIQRANYLKDDAVKSLENKLDSRELTISELQSNVKGLKENVTQLEESSKQDDEEKRSLTEQVEGLRSTNENNLALIQEYKEKIDTLSSLVNEYKSYSVENVELKEKHAAEKEKIKAEFQQKENRFVSSIEEYKETTHDQQEQIEKLTEKLNSTIQVNEKETESLKANFENQLTQLTSQKDLEKERAVLEAERKYQEQLQAIHDQYNEKIARLYEKFERVENNSKEKN